MLHKIELIDIKTHKITKINFKKGLNVLHGDNGTGKSSVLEMIGFVLFDFLPENQADYVRETHSDKPEYGRVRVWITDIKGQPYIIERTVGKPGVIVKDALTLSKVPKIRGVNQLKAWIGKNILPMHNIKLDKLFDSSIGIPQGTFINPFLRRESNRKLYFDPIMQLDVYEKVFKNLNELNKKFEPDVQVINETMHEIIGEIKVKEEIQQRKKSLNAEIVSLTENLTNSESKSKVLKEKHEEIKKIKEQIDEAQKKLDQLNIRSEEENKKLEDIKIQLADAQSAKQICDDTKEAHDKYVDLDSNLKILEQEFDELNAQKEDLSKKNEIYIKNSTKLTQLEEELKKAEAKEKKLPKLEKIYQKHSELADRIREIDAKIGVINAKEEQQVRLEEKASTISNNIETLKEKLSELPELEERFNNMEAIELRIKKHEINVESLTNQLEFFQNNQEKINQHKCPFVDQICKNLEEGTFDEDILNNEIRTKEKSLQNTQKQIKKNKEEISEKKKLKEKIDDLGKDKTTINNYRIQHQDYQNEIEAFKKEVGIKPQVIRNKEEQEQKRQLLEEDVEEYLVIKNEVEKIPVLKEGIEPLRLQVTNQNKEVKNIKIEIKKLEHIPGDLSKTKDIIASLTDRYNSFILHIKTANKVPHLEAKKDSAFTNLKETENQSKHQDQILTDLKPKFDNEEFLRTDKDIKDTDQNIAVLNSQLDEKRKNLEECEAKLKEVSEKEEELEGLKNQKAKINTLKSFLEKLRVWIREFVPKFRAALIAKINVIASEIYRSIREEEDAGLKWLKNYDIEITTSKSSKKFSKLSGGEKMAAALSVRLAILKSLADIDFAFFDEPTTNLDQTSRINLSKYIHNIKGFEQLFVISHDDSFKRQSEYVIKFTKDDQEQTKIVVL